MDDRLVKTVEGFAEDVSAAAGDRLVSLTLYGSAAAGDFVPGSSDLNFILALDRVDEELLRELIKPVKKWKGKGVAVPLVMDLADFRKSLDSFPLEFLQMSSAYEVVRGEDLLSEVVIDRADLRLQCEREVKGKLILLRQGYITAGKSKKARAGLFRDSIKAFLAIMRGMLWLEGVRPAPLAGASVIEMIEEKSGLKLTHMKKVLEFKTGKPKMANTEAFRLFGGYLAETAALADWIDLWQTPQKAAAGEAR